MNFASSQCHRFTHVANRIAIRQLHARHISVAQVMAMRRQLPFVPCRRSHHIREGLKTCRLYCTGVKQQSEFEFDRTCEETLDSLRDKFEDLSDRLTDADFDVDFANGVITVVMGDQLGTYVINKQKPNKQIWLSSPVSGPKRFDLQNGSWIYHHDNTTLHNTLSSELTRLLRQNVSFSDCAYSGQTSADGSSQQ